MSRDRRIGGSPGNVKRDGLRSVNWLQGYKTLIYLHTTHSVIRPTTTVIPLLHDPANVQQTSNKCIQNTRANCSTFAGNLLDVCWTSAGSLLNICWTLTYVIMDEPARCLLDVCWIV